MGQQQVGEQKVAEMIGAELKFEAVRGAAEWRGHHAGVVDEPIDTRVTHPDRRSSGAHAGQRREIQLAAFDPLGGQ